MTLKGKVLIVDEMHESILPMFRVEGFEPVYLPMINRNDILAIVHEFTGLVIRSKTKVDKELIDAATHLRFVARAGAGIDKLNETYLKEKKIAIVNAPEGNRDALAEHTLGMLLSLLHRLHFSYDQIRKGIWDREGNRGIELKGKVVGVYGVGFMGMAFSSKLKNLECEVLGYDKYRTQFSNDSIEEVSLEEFQKRVEILSIHIPLTQETTYLFDQSYFELFSNLKVVINTSRGKVLKMKDLLKLLDQKRFLGAALDVLENEKPETYTQEEKDQLLRLTEHPNILITPHIGGWTYESYERINTILIEKLKKSFRLRF